MKKFSILFLVLLFCFACSSGKSENKEINDSDGNRQEILTTIQHQATIRKQTIQILLAASARPIRATPKKTALLTNPDACPKTTAHHTLANVILPTTLTGISAARLIHPKKAENACATLITPSPKTNRENASPSVPKIRSKALTATARTVRSASRESA